MMYECLFKQVILQQVDQKSLAKLRQFPRRLRNILGSNESNEEGDDSDSAVDEAEE